MAVVNGLNNLLTKFGIWKAMIANPKKRTTSADLLKGCARMNRSGKRRGGCGKEARLVILFLPVHDYAIHAAPQIVAIMRRASKVLRRSI